MKRYYCLIPTTGKITAAIKVFRVSVGATAKDGAQVLFAADWAKRQGIYFHVWDDKANKEIDSRLIQRQSDYFSIGRGCKVVYVSISSLVQAIVAGTLHSLEDDPKATRNYFRMASTLSPSFFFRNIGAKVTKSLPPFPRKNLSVRPSTDDICAAIGFAALLFLYWLGCLLIQWEKAVCG